MDSINLKIYPSGFLGSAAVEQTAPKDLQNAVKQMFNRSNIPSSNPYTANLEVLDLWITATNSETEFKTFEFKERILKAAKVAFGTQTLVQWITAQWESKEYGDVHSRWIDETLLYVLEGKNRELTVNAWSAILTAGDNDAGPRQYSKVVKSTLLNNPWGEVREFMSIDEFILRWVRRDGGITDLLQSLHVLFGTRR